MAAAAAAIAAVKRNREVMENGKTDVQLMKELQDEESATRDTTYTDPELHPKYKLYLSTWTAFSIELVEGKYESPWATLVLGAIMAAGILVGVQTFPFLETATWVVAIDMFVLGVFVLEIAVKMGVEGVRPWMFFANKEWRWNWFDFIIVLFCIPLPESLVGGGASIAPVLRLFRLARLMKLIKKVPQLQMIVMGLIGGLRSIGYISLLLVLIFYLFAILGVSMFRATDPFHWKTVPIAFMTLFRAATLEDWTDLMYINIYGCQHYSGGIYHSGVSLSDSQNMALTRNISLDELTDPMFKKFILNTHNDRYHCAKMNYNASDVAPVSDFVESSALGDMLVVSYFVLFITISALVMLSLFVGSVTMSMSESMAQMKAEHEEQDRKRRMLKMMKTTKAAGENLPEQLDEQASAPASSLKKAERERLRAAREMRAMFAELVEINEPDHSNSNLDHFPDTLAGKYQLLALRCDHIATHPVFAYAIMVVIVFAGILVGVETNIEEPTSAQEDIFAKLDVIITAVFIFEIVVKVIAEEFEPLHFFHSKWNTFDLFVVACSFIPSIGDLAVILRLLRLLRVLKLIKSMPQLAVIVNALLMGVSSIGFISAILVLFFYVFAIVGIFFFRDNDPLHFGNLFVAMLTLYRMATFEDWTDVMYINFYGCDKYGYTDDEWLVDKCTKPHASTYTSMLYSFVFVLIGGLVLLTLFIGVVTTSMEEATEQQRQDEEVQQRVLDVARRENLDAGAMNKLKLVFNKLDLDGGGTIEEDELRHGLRSIGRDISNDMMSELMDLVDEDKSGSIDLAEFVEFVVLLKKGTPGADSVLFGEAGSGSLEDEDTAEAGQERGELKEEEVDKKPQPRKSADTTDREAWAGEDLTNAGEHVGIEMPAHSVADTPVGQASSPDRSAALTEPPAAKGSLAQMFTPRGSSSKVHPVSDSNGGPPPDSSGGTARSSSSGDLEVTDLGGERPKPKDGDTDVGTLGV